MIPQILYGAVPEYLLYPPDIIEEKTKKKRTKKSLQNKAEKRRK